jgi:hypothetical protein
LVKHFKRHFPLALVLAASLVLAFVFKVDCWFFWVLDFRGFFSLRFFRLFFDRFWRWTLVKDASLNGPNPVTAVE